MSSTDSSEKHCHSVPLRHPGEKMADPTRRRRACRYCRVALVQPRRPGRPSTVCEPCGVKYQHRKKPGPRAKPGPKPGSRRSLPGKTPVQMSAFDAILAHYKFIDDYEYARRGLWLRGGTEELVEDPKDGIVWDWKHWQSGNGAKHRMDREKRGWIARRDKDDKHWIPGRAEWDARGYCEADDFEWGPTPDEGKTGRRVGRRVIAASDLRPGIDMLDPQPGLYLAPPPGLYPEPPPWE